MSIRVFLLAIGNTTAGCYNFNGKPARGCAMVGSFKLAEPYPRTHSRWRLRHALHLLITAIAVAISLAIVPLLILVFALCFAFEQVRQYFGDRRR
jgi:hypothetical protein